MIRSHDEDELVGVTKTHVKKAHDMNLSDEEAKKQIKYN